MYCIYLSKSIVYSVRILCTQMHCLLDSRYSHSVVLMSFGTSLLLPCDIGHFDFVHNRGVGYGGFAGYGQSMAGDTFQVDMQCRADCTWNKRWCTSFSVGCRSPQQC
jgi:hypothetical protein